MQTFAEICRGYARAKNVSRAQGHALTRACRIHVAELGRLGSAPGDKIRNRHVAEVARKLYPQGPGSTQNREVIGPIVAALRWAAREDIIPAAPLVDRAKEDKVLSRRPADGTLDKLIAAADSRAERAFLAVLRYQGWRLSEARDLKWDDVDLPGGLLTVWVGKVRTEKMLAMHGEVAAAIRAHLEDGAEDVFVFPWRTNAEVYSWLNPLADRCEVKFTPHMARHEFASRLNEVAGATPADLVALGTWTSTSAVGRYIHPGDAHSRAMLAKL